MPYIGNSHVVGDHTSNFKVLDDISSYTATFDGSASAVVSSADETIRIINHRFIQGQRVTYNNGGGSNIGGISSGTAYYVIYDTAHTIKLATSASNAASLTATNLSGVGGGTSHTLNVAFDGTNTKFKITHSSGSSPRISDATQLQVAINNVIQRPNKNDASFTEGYAVQDRKILFKTAPTSSDIFWGSLIGEAHETFDISDNKVDTYTGDGSTTTFVLSKVPSSNNDLDVTLDGVTQHLTAFSIIENELTFTAAPSNGVAIQIKHIGFAGASTSGVTGFYGRTGNVGLNANDHITIGDITSRNINSSGIITATQIDLNGDIDVDGHTNLDNLSVAGIATFAGNLNVGGILTYEDVKNVDSVGLGTFRDGLIVNTGTATTALVVQGDARVTGILTVGTGSLKITDRDIHAVGVVTGSNFKTGSSNLHSAGVEVAGVNVLGADTPIGTGSTIYNSGAAVFTGVVTATSFSGSGANLTGILTATTIVGSGTNGIKLPIGTTAQRVNTTGTIRFNSTLDLPEYYNGSAWISIDSPPAVSSVSPTEVASAAGGNITFTINGARFSVGANVRFVSNTGTELTPSSVTRVSGTQLTAVIAKNSFVNGQEPYDVKVINSSGLAATLIDQINVDNAPAWVTSAGSIGSHANYANVNVTVSATDPDGDTVTYSVVSGSLPSGLSLNSSTGAITGTMGAVGSSTTVNFTIRATAGGKTADRAFSFVQSGTSSHAYSYTGSAQTLSIPSGLTSLTAYMWAGGGGGGGQHTGAGGRGQAAGAGAYSKAVLNLSGLTTLYLVVGKGGQSGQVANNSNNVGGGCGGGLTGIFDDSNTAHGDAILISGAGGGGSGDSDGSAGEGGGGGGANNNGRDGIPDSRIGQRTHGLGATTSAGGAAANASNSSSYTHTNPTAGSALTGGNSGSQTSGQSLRPSSYLGGGRSYIATIGNWMGGGGGSGYYGGGGGICGYAGGGGGGSGYAKGSVCSSIAAANGSDGTNQSTTAAPVNDSIHYASGVAVGGAPSTDGGDGRIVLVY